MLQKIQEVALSQAPITVCTTSAELKAAMQNFSDKQISIFIGRYSGQSWLMFTTVDVNQALTLNDAVAFDAPCPPFCDDVYVMV